MADPGAARTVRQVLRHDLRTPLAVIIGRCEMLEAEAYGGLTDGQRRSVEAISRNAQRLVEELEHLAEHLPAPALHLEIPEPATKE